MSEFKELLGKTLVSVSGAKGGDSIQFETSNGEKYQLYHEQDCCEVVTVDDICGEFQDLVGSPIIQAEENSSTDIFEGRPVNPDSFKWTFYRVATAKGQVVIRWLGESNGYYSESVDFKKL